MEKGMVSVIIPIYNVENYLEECIESVLHQTYDNYEVILVNDGSTDRSGEIAKKYSEKFNNIYLINQNNKGLSGARNTGIKHSRGEYLYFLDSDDMIQDNLLEICVSNLKNNNLDAVHFGYRLVKDNKVIKKSKVITCNKVLSGKEFFKDSVENALSQNHEAWAYMYKKKFWIDNNLSFKDITFVEDAEIYIRVLMSNIKIIEIPEFLYIYRVREGSIIRRKSYSINYLRSIDEVIKTYVEKMYENLDLEKEFKKYIRCFIQMKLKALSLLENLNEKILEEELKYTINLSNELNIEVDYIYFELVENKCNIEKIDIDIFKELGIDNKINEINSIKMKKLNKIELNNATMIIGVYGICNHTKNLLEYYKKEIGDIQAKIILIDTFMKEHFNEEYGLKVINLSQINEYKFDSILISAPYAEPILYNNLINSNYTGKIYRLYEDNKQLLFF